MIGRGATARTSGWLLAAAMASGLLYSAAAFALSAQRSAPVLVLTLAQLPPTAPAVNAVADVAPQAAAKTPPLPEEPAQPDSTQDLPAETLAPVFSPVAAMTLPKSDTPVSADISLPPPADKPVEKEIAKVETARVAPAKEPEKKAEPGKAKPKPEAKADKAAAPDSASTASAAAKAKGGTQSPAAYAKAVMKKVRSTRKKAGAGKGTVVVGFTVAADGQLAGVEVLKGAGNPELEQVALDHIWRASPFPPPPEGAGRSYSFEFVGR